MPDAKPKKKILIIDDEADFTTLVKMNLEKAGDYEVMTENVSSASLNTTKAFKPDLILLDILMPVVEGGEVAARLQEDMLTKDIPIVFLTAIVGRDEVKKHGGLIGGRVFVSKPVDIKELTEIIDKNAK